MEADLKTPEDKQVDEGDSDGEHSETSGAMCSTAKTDANKPSGSEIGGKKLFGDEVKGREVVGGVSVESSLRVIFKLNLFFNTQCFGYPNSILTGRSKSWFFMHFLKCS